MKAGKYLAAAAVAIKNRWAYRGNLAGSLLTYGLFVFIFSRIWATVYTGRAEIAGYGRAECVWYFVLAELGAFGFGRFYWGLDREMKSGQVAYLLARPYSFVGFLYSQAMGQALLESAIFLVEGSLIALLVAGPLPGEGAARLLLLGPSLLLAGSIQFLLQISLSMSAFWLEENTAFFWIYQKLGLIAGTLMPLEFLPETARRIALLTPFPYLTWAPARIALGKAGADAPWILGAQLLWLGFALLLALAVHARGSRRLSVNGG